MEVVEEPSNLFMIDQAYEFSAPRFHDFMSEENEEDVRKAELWFENALAYAPSRASASPLCFFGSSFLKFYRNLDYVDNSEFLELYVDFGIADSGWSTGVPVNLSLTSCHYVFPVSCYLCVDRGILGFRSFDFSTPAGRGRGCVSVNVMHQLVSDSRFQSIAVHLIFCFFYKTSC